METALEVLAPAGLLLAFPAVMLGALIATVGRRVEVPVPPVGRWSNAAYALLMVVVGAGVTLAGFAIPSLLRIDDWFFSVAIAVVLVVVLCATRKLPNHPVTGPLFGALAATVGVGIASVVDALTHFNDGAGLWAIGLFYAWIMCGLPLLLAASVIALVRRDAATMPE
ncbi:hypothetical protein M5J20_02615 [Corynebacterium sp. TA-R-1]|uniref:Uncharacterized protein n=1 Tax=Corynebacterium stercoris TaxID=2943490 RepID=A0ABT1FZ92_9CORY|nr:hypothetical protein [Corynebacterium stercoris]MCP1387084.1 hypothetical protein [Corynebacterium stercoris]